MRNKLMLPLLACTLLSMNSCGNKNNDDSVSLDYEKYVLANGLEVVLHHDDSDPVVSVAIQYHVGSNREKPGKTGFAHFFEHMLFQRSENLPRNAFFQKIDAMGGTFNGGTSNDGTVYYETVPRDALEKVLWMESDRMGYFINTVTEGGLKREIDVVSNEKRQGENAPYGLAFDLVFKNLFPEGHPYSWTVIGEIPDLRSATVEDVKEFYERYYLPGNATLVVAGDFDPAQTKALIEKYFGEIPARPVPEAPKTWNVELDATRKISYEDTFCNAPMLILAYPGVEAYHRDGYALDFLTNLLAGDKKSPLYKVLVEERKLAPEVEMFNYQLEISGMIVFDAKTFPGVKLDDVKAAYDEALARFERDGIDPKDLERYKITEETRTYNRLTSTNGKALAMAHDNVFGGTPDRMLKELDAYRSVTADDVMRVYEKYVKGRNLLAVSIYPEGEASLALTGSTQIAPEQETIGEQQMNAESGAVADDPYEKTPSRFDRSVEPDLLPNTPELKIPEIWSAVLGNGMTVKGIEYCELPLVNFTIELNDGMLLDDPDKVGVAYLTAQMLNEGTASRTPEELEDAIGQLGAQIRVAAARESMTVSGNCLKRNFPQVMALVGEMLLSPRWDEKSFAVVKERALDNIRQRSTEPKAIASDVFNKVIFGANNILSNNVTGTEASVQTITLDDLKAFYAAHFTPKAARMSFVGGLTRPEVERALAPLTEKWEATAVSIPLIDDNAARPAAKVFFADYPGARQSYVIVGSKAMPIADPDAYPAVIVNDKLGESAGSLLFEILRLQHGYTYGAYSGFSQGNLINTFQAWSSVQATVTRESLTLLRDILKNYGTDYSQQWLDHSKEAMLRTMNGALETPNAQLNMLRTIVLFGLPDDYVKQRENTLKTFTLDQAKTVIGKYLNFDDMTVVVVGDAKTQLEGVKSLGLGDPVLVDFSGRPIR
ncbi:MULTISPECIES: M16 family metallopeptidase [unclassified Alistipes]|uniref:M16 family metallopeptidase n=1 Tax=unclassified Alistipes TaxID=2608932 RepID=UPI000E4C010D|nr:pitrilysin family protein [Alistipes sp. AF48-12]RHO71959.1 insulinase family protein [Alistipes sp. AF48-12]